MRTAQQGATGMAVGLWLSIGSCGGVGAARPIGLAASRPLRSRTVAVNPAIVKTSRPRQGSVAPHRVPLLVADHHRLPARSLPNAEFGGVRECGQSIVRDVVLDPLSVSFGVFDRHTQGDQHLDYEPMPGLDACCEHLPRLGQEHAAVWQRGCQALAL